MGSLRAHRSKTPSLSDKLPYAAVVDRGIILNKDGSLMAAWRVKGPDVSSSTNLERNTLSARMNATLARLGSGFMFHMDAVRTASGGYPGPDRSHFPDPVSKLIDQERRESFEGRTAHFETETVLTVTYMPPELSTSRLANAMYTDETGGRMSAADKALSDFKTFLIEIEDLIDNTMQVERLWAHLHQDEYGVDYAPDALLSHLQHCISGREHPVNLPPVPMYLDALLGEDFHHGITPKVGDQYIGVVAIDGFPQESYPGMLADLDKLPMQYRWSTRFIFLDPVDARSRLEAYRRKWKQKAKPLLDQLFKTNAGAVDSDAMSMVEDSEEAMAEAASQLVAYGYYSANIIIYSDNPSALEDQLAYVRRIVNNAGFNGRIETINAVEAYLGSLPGNGYANIRRPLLHTMNLADLLPLNSIWAGREINPCPFYPDKSPPLMQVASAGSTPFRVNLHVHDVGHTLIFGPTGSGKSTLLALIAAQFRRYKGAQIFCFDKGRSMMPLTLACGGTHYDVGGNDSDLLFCPLSMVNSDFDQSWAEDWLTTILQLQGLTVTPGMRNEMHRAMGVVRGSNAEKTITNLISTLQDKELREALQYYALGGTMGKLLDNSADTLGDGNFLTFEMEELMDLGEPALMPVLLYLFNRIERRLTGAPSLIILDEAWMMLGHPAFRDKIRSWLKVLRKANCAVIMATQSLSDAARSGIIDVLTESCPTKILLPNSEAREDNSREFYTNLGLNERQIEILSGATPKREYYMLSPEGRRLFDMELGPVSLAFTGASGPEDVARVRELNNAHGSSWITQWLRERGLDHAIPTEFPNIDSSGGGDGVYQLASTSG